jgi:hypothetical protein
MQSEMQLALKNGDISCLGAAFSRQQVRRNSRSELPLPRHCSAYHFMLLFLSFALTTSSQEQKVYVQHIIPQHARHIAAAVASGACVVVCGAALHMPKAVFAAFAEAIAAGSNTSIEDAEEVLKGVCMDCCHRMQGAADTASQAWSALSATCSTHGRKVVRNEGQQRFTARAHLQHLSHQIRSAHSAPDGVSYP